MSSQGNLAVIPARSGSRGLKDKNIRLLNGKPLLAYTIESARRSRLFDEIFVSTDSELYAKVAVQCGANVPFLRSEDLSTDTASSLDAVKDAVWKYEQMGRNFETVAILQPTSPLRRAKDILEGYRILDAQLANVVIAVCEMDHSPLWSNILPENRSLANFLRGDIENVPRQNLPTYYRINGALYIVRTDYLMATESLYGEKSYAIIMPKEFSIDIDDELDLAVAEVLMRSALRNA